MAELKFILDLIKEQPIAIVLMVVIWWLFRRIKEQSLQMMDVFKASCKITDATSDVVVTVKGLESTINACCKYGGRRDDRS